jgi:hypothetical protein
MVKELEWTEMAQLAVFSILFKSLIVLWLAKMSSQARSLKNQ